VVKKVAHNVLVARVGRTKERWQTFGSSCCVNANASLDTALNRREVAVECGIAKLSLAVLSKERLSSESDDRNGSDCKDNESLGIHGRRGKSPNR
jgi:hypothetical protein